MAVAVAAAAGLRCHRAMSAADPPLPPGNPQDGLRGQVPVSPSSGAQHTMTSLLWALLRKSPVACAPSVPVREVLAHMRAQRVGAMVAVHADFTPAGILTERDITATHTAQRLRLAAAGAPGTASAQETEAMVDAFHFIQSLRLKRQFKAMEDGGPPNEIELASLNQLDHRILQEAFHRARKLQSRLRLDYAL